MNYPVRPHQARLQAAIQEADDLQDLRERLVDHMERSSKARSQVDRDRHRIAAANLQRQICRLQAG